MHRVLVTGGLGFIGSNLINILLNQKFKVINIDKVSYASNFYNTKEILFFLLQLSSKILSPQTSTKLSFPEAFKISLLRIILKRMVKEKIAEIKKGGDDNNSTIILTPIYKLMREYLNYDEIYRNN